MEVNISGLKPRPHRWPEHLIMSMMEIMSENSDQIIRTDGAGVNAFAGAGDVAGGVSPFFQPNLNTLPTEHGIPYPNHTTEQSEQPHSELFRPHQGAYQRSVHEWNRLE